MGSCSRILFGKDEDNEVLDLSPNSFYRDSASYQCHPRANTEANKLLEATALWRSFHFKSWTLHESYSWKIQLFRLLTPQNPLQPQDCLCWRGRPRAGKGSLGPFITAWTLLNRWAVGRNPRTTKSFCSTQQPLQPGLGKYVLSSQVLHLYGVYKR